MKWQHRELIARAKEWLAGKVAYALPRRVVTWAFIRIWSHGTTGRHGNTNAVEVLPAELLRRWDKPNTKVDA